MQIQQYWVFLKMQMIWLNPVTHKVHLLNKMNINLFTKYLPWYLLLSNYMDLSTGMNLRSMK